MIARHGFGWGEYPDFADPLPEAVAALRRAFSAPLVPVANAWAEQLGAAAGFPATLEEMRARCHAAAQTPRLSEAVVFAVHDRPVQGSRGAWRVHLRHRVGMLLRGQRHTLGLIFHDAA